MALIKIRNETDDGWITVGGAIEIVQQDDPPSPTYPGMLWLDTDEPSFAGTLIVDSDLDTKVQTEKTADEDTIRFDAGGTENIIVLTDSAISGTLVANEDDMSSNSESFICTQQSIKAYADLHILKSLADTVNDFLVASGDNVWVKKTLAEVGAILEGDLDHGSIQGLGDDDHSKYPLVTNFEADRATIATAWTDLTDGGASTAHKHDHGGQDGLGDDDHSKYPLVTDFEADRATIGTNWTDLTDAGETALHTHADAGSSSAFSSGNKTAQSIAPDTWVKITFGAARYDLNSEWDNANDRWVCKINGIYQINCRIAYVAAPWSTFDNIYCTIRVNNTAEIYMQHFCDYPRNQNLMANVSGALELGVDDYVELWTYHTLGGIDRPIYTADIWTAFDITKA
jgi:hypothetical protein